MTVTFDFIAETEDELTVSAGEKVRVLDSAGDSGWITVARMDGAAIKEQGLVPESHVDAVEGDPLATLATTSRAAPTVAFYDLPLAEASATTPALFATTSDPTVKLMQVTHEFVAETKDE